MTVVARCSRIVALYTVRFFQIAAIDNILVIGLPPIQWAVIFRGWQARVQRDRERAFPVLDRLFYILRVKSDDQDEDSECY
jgi:hypothetical protein